MFSVWTWHEVTFPLHKYEVHAFIHTCAQKHLSEINKDMTDTCQLPVTCQAICYAFRLQFDPNLTWIFHQIGLHMHDVTKNQKYTVQTELLQLKYCTIFKIHSWHSPIKMIMWTKRAPIYRYHWKVLTPITFQSWIRYNTWIMKDFSFKVCTHKRDIISISSIITSLSCYQFHSHIFVRIRHLP